MVPEKKERLKKSRMAGCDGRDDGQNRAEAQPSARALKVWEEATTESLAQHSRNQN
jgi:hypothetical protein